MPDFYSDLLMVLLVIAAIALMFWLLQRFPYNRVIVSDREWALHYKSGVFVKVLPAGVHRFWGACRINWADVASYDVYGRNVSPQDRRTHEIVLLEKRQLMEQLPGQEVLTKDTVGLKVSFVVFYHIADPQKSYQMADDYRTQLYNMIQLGLRAAVGAKTMDELLSDREAIGNEAHELIKDRVAELGLEITSLSIRDVMLSKEIRAAYAAVVAAQKDGLAALERARGESAALRNLANAAQMLKNNPELMQLRLLQSINADDTGTKNFVIGLPAEYGLRHPGRSSDET